MRAFIAIEIDEAVRERIAALQVALRKSAPRLRWTDPRHMHLTLKFLGEVDDSQTAEVREELDRIAASTAPFTIDMRGAGAFPPSGPPRVVWMGVVDGSGALARCRDAVEAAIAPLGFPTEDRPFHPHLTLARCPDPRETRSLRAVLDAHRDVEAGEMPVRRIVLFRSTLTRQGPIYEPISVHEFQG